MGVVYAARQASIDRTVAVKMLKPDIANHAEQREKFLSEAVVTGDLDHPNIVPIYDLGASEAGALFYSMKRVQGTPWMTVIEEKSSAENVEILMKVADAVAFAHSRGVIHRDLKPENVMLGDYGEVLVMDWGLAMSTALFRKAESITQTSSMGGTPAYMAPEMATGPVDRIGPPADVYLLGAILYEIITGKPPHTGKNVMNCLFAAAKNEIQPTEHSGELLEIAMRAMSTSPADRPATVQDFQNEIREYQSHSESIVLSTRAEEDLARAEQSGDYQVFAKSLFAYQEAYALWDGNSKAKNGISVAKLAYARQATKKEDYDLAASLLDAEDPTHADLSREILAAQRERDSRQQRLKTIRRVAVIMGVAVVAVLTVGFVLVTQERDKAQVAEQAAEKSAKDANEQRGIAETKKTEADNERMAAITAQRTGRTECRGSKSRYCAREFSEDGGHCEKGRGRQSSSRGRGGEKGRRVSSLYRSNRLGRGEDRRKLVRHSRPASRCLPRRASRLGMGPVALSHDAKRPQPSSQRSTTRSRPTWRRTFCRETKTRKSKPRRSSRSPTHPTASDLFPEAGMESHGFGTWRVAKCCARSPMGVSTFTRSPFHRIRKGNTWPWGATTRSLRFQIFDSTTGKLVQGISPKPVGNPPREAEISRVTFSRDGQRLLTASYDNTARLWDVEYRQRAASISRPHVVGLVGGLFGRRVADRHRQPGRHRDRLEY